MDKTKKICDLFVEKYRGYIPLLVAKKNSPLDKSDICPLVGELCCDDIIYSSGAYIYCCDELYKEIYNITLSEKEINFANKAEEYRQSFQHQRSKNKLRDKNNQ